jgi:hypothetical protein
VVGLFWVDACLTVVHGGATPGTVRRYSKLGDGHRPKEGAVPAAREEGSRRRPRTSAECRSWFNAWPNPAWVLFALCSTVECAWGTGLCWVESRASGRVPACLCAGSGGVKRKKVKTKEDWDVGPWTNLDFGHWPLGLAHSGDFDERGPSPRPRVWARVCQGGVNWPATVALAGLLVPG